MAEADDLRDAFRHLLTQLEVAGDELHRFRAADDPVGLARGYQHLGRQLIKGVEEHLLRDADHPFGRVLDDRIRTGGDNPDQRYLFAPIRGGEAYRVFGRKGSAARIELQLYRREPYGGEDVGVGYLPDEAIDYADDGTFSIDLGPEVTGSGTLVNPPDATILNIRQIWSEWGDTDPGAVYVDRVGWEGARKLTDSPASVAERLRAAGDDIAASVPCWPELVENGPMTFLEVNTLGPLVSPGARAGVVGRWISIGHYDLAPGQALVVRIPPSGAPYQGTQLADLWFASLEYASATSSITADQAHHAPDGSQYLVLSLDDPGYVNWLDPAGVSRGVVHIRFDGLDAQPVDPPTARLVSLDRLAEVVPDLADGQFDAAARAAQRAARRRHVQVRYGR
ncbi:MAG: hypothetical protein AAGE98_00990 [Actinomycetota bacterium]